MRFTAGPSSKNSGLEPGFMDSPLVRKDPTATVGSFAFTLRNENTDWRTEDECG